MASLAQHYKQKEKNGTGTAVNKTYIVPVKELYVEPGYNVRDIDQEHVNEFRDAFIAGEFIPPLVVKVTELGIKVMDGHHRYYGALAATEAGHEVLRLECKDFVGSEAYQIAFMVTSSQGKPLSAIERGMAYRRLVNQGWTNSEIAKKVKRSPADIDLHLQLTECDEKIIGMVKSGQVAATTAVAMTKEHGADAGRFAEDKLEKVKSEGRAKITKADAMPQFSAKKARRFLELYSSGGGELNAEMAGIISEFESFNN